MHRAAAASAALGAEATPAARVAAAAAAGFQEGAPGVCLSAADSRSLSAILLIGWCARRRTIKVVRSVGPRTRARGSSVWTGRAARAEYRQVTSGHKLNPNKRDSSEVAAAAGSIGGRRRARGTSSIRDIDRGPPARPPALGDTARARERAGAQRKPLEAVCQGGAFCDAARGRSSRRCPCLGRQDVLGPAACARAKPKQSHSFSCPLLSRADPSHLPKQKDTPLNNSIQLPHCI